MPDIQPSLSICNFSPTIAQPEEVELPRMLEVEQRFPEDAVPDVRASVREALAQFIGLDLKGKQIAITAGSRGIQGMVDTLAGIVDQLQTWGARPFLVPAMGSHGGATSEGQVAVLNSLGITEATVGAPVRSSMEVVEIGHLSNGTPVCCDRLAFESDGIVVCNRIKAHTGFLGEYESGLLKMMVIGLGKHLGTTGIHRLGFRAFAKAIPEAATVFLNRAPVIFGVGLVENAYNQVACIEAMPPDEIMPRERALLTYAKSIMGRLLVPEIDILVVDELGKDISGAGMDSNITGRAASGIARPDAPQVDTIIVRDLTEKTKGNALGMGLADFMCLRAADKVDLSSAYTNAVTAGALQGAKISIIAATDRDALSLAVRAGLGSSGKEKRIVHIRNTKSLETIWLSESLVKEYSDRPDLIVQGEPSPYEFDPSGSMTWPTQRC